MKSKKSIRAALAAVFLIGILIPAAIAAIVQQNTNRNNDGQTYGSGYVETPTSVCMPDLILAKGLDGALGYVYADEVRFGSFKKPANDAERTAYNEQVLKLAYEQQSKGEDYLWYIPLYESDGKTVIGQFGVGNPKQTIEDFAGKTD